MDALAVRCSIRRNRRLRFTLGLPVLMAAYRTITVSEVFLFAERPTTPGLASGINSPKMIVKTLGYARRSLHCPVFAGGVRAVAVQPTEHMSGFEVL